MINTILLVASVFVSVQCILYTPPYPQSCSSCGMPALPAMQAIVPANPPCANPGPISILASPYEVPLAGPVAKMPLISAPYEVPLALPAGGCGVPKGQIVAASLPLGSPANLPVNLPVALPAPVSKVVAQPSCGCLEAAVPQFELPLPYGIPIGNPFLPAASPVSAMAPYSMLPPASPCSRCQYLKKIPIPPPCI